MLQKRYFIYFFPLLLILMSSFIFRKYFFKSWAPYYQKTLYKNPRPLFLKAILYIEQNQTSKKAFDIGAGSGNETAYLLNHGWQVWALDKEKAAIDIIATRKDIKERKHNLTLIQKKFCDIDWQHLPEFDFIYAGYALPFIAPADFALFWQQLICTLKKDGIIAGNFFGPEHTGFNNREKQGMTFHSKEQLLDLFKDFKILHFEEFHQKNDAGIFDHTFDVIAQKTK